MTNPPLMDQMLLRLRIRAILEHHGVELGLDLVLAALEREIELAVREQHDLV